jgi:hypothetical protein
MTCGYGIDAIDVSRKKRRCSTNICFSEILEAWLDSPVEFADNECERVRLTDLRRQCLHLRGRFAQRLFLVHAIHDRHADSPGVDEFSRVTT